MSDPLKKPVEPHDPRIAALVEAVLPHPGLDRLVASYVPPPKEICLRSFYTLTANRAGGIDIWCPMRDGRSIWLTARFVRLTARSPNDCECRLSGRGAFPPTAGVCVHFEGRRVPRVASVSMLWDVGTTAYGPASPLETEADVLELCAEAGVPVEYPHGPLSVGPRRSRARFRRAAAQLRNIGDVFDV
jgi:hypothetical protein